VPVRLVILASGSGTTLQSLLDAAAAGRLGAEVVAAGSDRPGCRAMKRAEDAGIATFALDLADFADRTSWNSAISDRIAGYEPDMVVLAGFMRVLDADVVERFRMVNTHPSLLPAFPGAHAVRDALRHGVKVTGVTIHWVDSGLDSGPIIAQRAVEVHAEDTENSLRERIQEVEKPLYIATIRQLCRSIEESGP
jgi:formyltetrahydrofolate-dependent phosphoribosylglycinamide formyltransferase